MRNVLAAALAAGVLAIAAPGASAAADSTYAGDCKLKAFPDPSGQSTYVGTLNATVFVSSIPTPTDNPVSAVVTCAVVVNGAMTSAGFSWAGTTLITHTETVQFVANPAPTGTDVVEVCTAVDYTSNATATASFCNPWPP